MAADGNAGLKLRQHGEGRDRVTGGTSIWGGRIALRRRPSNEVLMGCFASHGETAEVGSQDESKKDDGSISFQMHGRRGSMRARVLCPQVSSKRFLPFFFFARSRSFPSLLASALRRPLTPPQTTTRGQWRGRDLIWNGTCEGEQHDAAQSLLRGSSAGSFDGIDLHVCRVYFVSKCCYQLPYV